MNSPTEDALITRLATGTTVRMSEHGGGTIEIPGSEDLTLDQMNEVYRKARQLQKSKPVDPEKLAKKLRELTPDVPTQEQDDAETRVIESESRKVLLKDGCPPCYPADLPCPLREPHVPEHLKDIMEYWSFFSGPSPNTLLSQLHEWNRFRKFQAHERCRYGTRKFHRYVERLHERLQRHGVGCEVDAVNLHYDVKQQGRLDNWIEFQDYELFRFEGFEMERDKAAKKEREKATKEAAGEKEAAPAEPIHSSVGGPLSRLERATRDFERHKTLLSWIQQERRVMEENPQPAAMEQDAVAEGGQTSSSDDDIDEVVKEVAALFDDDRMVAQLKETVRYIRNLLKPSDAPGPSSTAEASRVQNATEASGANEAEKAPDGQSGNAVPAAEDTTDAPAGKDVQQASTGEREGNASVAEGPAEASGAENIEEAPANGGGNNAASANGRNEASAAQDTEEAPGATESSPAAVDQSGQDAPAAEDTEGLQRPNTRQPRKRGREENTEPEVPAEKRAKRKKAEPRQNAPAADDTEAPQKPNTRQSRKRGREENTEPEVPAEKRARRGKAEPRQDAAQKPNTRQPRKRGRQVNTEPKVPAKKRARRKKAEPRQAPPAPPARKEVRTRSGRISRPPIRWVPTF